MKMKQKSKKMLNIAGVFLFFAASAFAEGNEKGIEYYRAELYGAAKIFFLGQTNQTPTEKAENFYYLGQTYYQLNQLDSAKFYYQQAIDTDPEYPFGYVGIGKLELKQNGIKAAEESFKKATGLAKKNPATHTTIAEVYVDAGLYDNATEALEKARKVNKNYSGIYVVEGDMLFKQGKIGDACSHYDNAILYNKQDKVAYLKIAKVYKEVNTAEALNYLDKLIAIDPNYIPAYAEIGDIHREEGVYGKAIDAYEKFISIPGVPMLQQERYAQLLYFTDQFDKSLEQIKHVLAQDPENFVLHRIEAYNNFKLENFDLSLEQLSSLLKSTDAERHIYMDYLFLGNMYMKKKQYKDALESFQKALAIDGSKAEIYKSLAEAASKVPDYDEVVKNYEKYFETGGDAVVAADYFYYGTTLFSAARAIAVREDTTVVVTPEQAAAEDAVFYSHIEKGDKAFSTIITRLPNSYMGYLWKANLYTLVDSYKQAKTGNFEGIAKQYVDEALAFMLGHNDTGARNKDIIDTCYRYLVSYYFLQEDNASVIDYSKKILEIDPNDEPSKKTLDQLKVKY
jgi:tetratricopeptide (TPR) repeat protein